MMKGQSVIDYEVPTVSIIEVEVEKGFAISGTEGYDPNGGDLTLP